MTLLQKFLDPLSDKHNKYKGVRGVGRAAGSLSELARTFIDEVVGGNVRAIGIDLMHNQAYVMAKLIEELRREQQHTVDFANGVT